MVDGSSREASLYWRKSSASSTDDCVEVASLGPVVLVRDSRDRSTGVLAFDSAQWNSLLTAIQSGRLDGRGVG